MNYQQALEYNVKVVENYPVVLETAEDKKYGTDKEELPYFRYYAACALTVLGGVNRVKTMLNARELHILPRERGGIRFKYSGNPDYNILEVYVNGLDLYNIRTFKLHGGKVVREVSEDNIYVEDLRGRVEQMIQLYLSL